MVFFFFAALASFSPRKLSDGPEYVRELHHPELDDVAGTSGASVIRSPLTNVPFALSRSLSM